MDNGIKTDFLEFDIYSKKLFVVQDHPTALYCWKRAFDIGIIEKNSTLFHIDKHADFTFDEKNSTKSSGLLNMDNDELLEFITSDLHSDHSEFIVNAMFSGLIGDGISIQFDKGHCYGEEKKQKYSTTTSMEFETEDGEVHHYYLYDTQILTKLIGYKCLIGDHLIHQDTNTLFEESENLILDIDLDFFTYQVDGSAFPRHMLDIEAQIQSTSFKKIFQKSKLITIALEPTHCGGIDRSYEIFNVLYELLFKSEDPNMLNEVKAKFNPERKKLFS